LNERLVNVSIAAFHATEMTEQMQVEQEGVAAIYRYGNPKRLWVPYSVGLGIALVNIVIGVIAAYRNRGIVENGFLQNCSSYQKSPGGGVISRRGLRANTSQT